MTQPSRTNLSLLLGIILSTGVVAVDAVGQSVSLGTDLVSRYVWRGADFGESLSIQPTLTVSGTGLEVGAWASYATNPAGAGVNELDLWVGYTIETSSSGSVSFGVTDYYFPAPDAPTLFNFENGGEGAHWIEPFASYTGPSSFPITIYGAAFVHNDPDDSIYLEASYPFQVQDVELGLTAGASAGESSLYGTTKFTFINLGVSASKSVPITDQFALPLFVSYIVNPTPGAARSFLVVGISL
ncbi:MAG: hypothetical protein HKN13_09195 [Rhodothermales bacterium]|nr:hypothetical protein [Rhodothermales bacterium]